METIFFLLIIVIALGIIYAKLFFFFFFSCHYSSFPGGHVDAGDGTPEGTALRELREELGLEASDIEVLGRLVNLPDKYGTSYITPVIGHVKNYLPGTLRVSCAEVKCFVCSMRKKKG